MPIVVRKINATRPSRAYEYILDASPAVAMQVVDSYRRADNIKTLHMYRRT